MTRRTLALLVSIAVTAKAGPFQQQVATRTEERGSFRIVFVTCEFERGPLEVKVVFDAADEKGRAGTPKSRSGAAILFLSGGASAERSLRQAQADEASVLGVALAGHAAAESD